MDNRRSSGNKIMKIIYAQEKIVSNKVVSNKGKTIFLAGPTPRDIDTVSWRGDAVRIFAEMGFDGTLLIPEPRNGTFDNFEYGAQIDWEQEGLEQADTIMFWIPRDMITMPALTTNIEFGFHLASTPSKIIMGYPQDAPRMNYIRYKCHQHGIITHEYLSDTIQATLNEKI